MKDKELIDQKDQDTLESNNRQHMGKIHEK